ncbi:hypothetical protein H310_05893 [Aphanomyces invadans]|uniref:MARVEL domain-containing protein n=1 Tax=Aphanomyces invadans TaxID=157072 RepID=A0A024U7X5_9STRA|nr:hypothetical protein H310_05893 [Aphanomyces invadans]ETW02359.1 hypothetical protein H310_05893 [Aphanomyces invadans]|eukprot:XP_008868964.1 hypothetical protein H310_05893 [Aphanomyces invadans]
MLAILHSKTALFSLRAITMVVAAFVATYVWVNQHRPCDPAAEARYDLDHEDVPLMTSALVITIFIPVWMGLHRFRFNCVVKFNYACELLSFVLVFVPTVYWGSSRTASLACDGRRRRKSVCLQNTCTIVRASMIASCVLMGMLALSSIVVLHQWRASAIVSLNKSLAAPDGEATIIDVETPRGTDHTEIQTPMTVDGRTLSIQSSL